MISVVVPTANSERLLPRCFDSLIAGAVRGVVREVIVSDAGSTDGTLVIVDAAGAHIVHARNQGQAVILITHNFRHALSVADDLTVLAQGRMAAHFRRDEIELDELTDLVARVA